MVEHAPRGTVCEMCVDSASDLDESVGADEDASTAQIVAAATGGTVMAAAAHIDAPTMAAAS